ncbi:MAG: desulfoferrodoxin [Bacillota bacterium]
MTALQEIYKCQICGNMVEVVHTGAGTLVCCGQPMQLMDAHQRDGAGEKHVPVVERTADGVKVTVSTVTHPMEEKHWIEWIEVIVDGKVYRQHLAPGQAPEATFCVTGENITARAYCNLHGLWEAE